MTHWVSFEPPLSHLMSFIKIFSLNIDNFLIGCFFLDPVGQYTFRSLLPGGALFLLLAAGLSGFASWAKCANAAGLMLQALQFWIYDKCVAACRSRLGLD